MNTDQVGNSPDEEPLIVVNRQHLLAALEEPQTASIFRSEDMAYCEVVIEMEDAYKCVAALGEISRVQFINLNAETPAFKQNFATEVHLCNELERQIARIEGEIKKQGIPLSRDVDDGDVNVPTSKSFEQLRTTLEEYETELNGDATAIESLKEQRFELDHLQSAIELFEQYFQISGSDSKSGGRSRTYSVVKISGHTRTASTATFSFSDIPKAVDGTDMAELGYVMGVIDRKKLEPFENMLWRIGRGNILLRSSNVSTESEDSDHHKVASNVFMAVFHGDLLKEKVEQICQAFHGKLLQQQLPANSQEQQKMLKEIKARREEIVAVIKTALEHQHSIMEKLAQLCRTWKVQVRKVKAVYHTMNMFTVDENHMYLIGQCWVPDIYYHHVDITLKAVPSGGAEMGEFALYRLPTPRDQIVPTFFQTNKVSKAYQNIVHAYSIAKYKEINPALFTTITFPFLFAVMFGDLGHGIIMASFGAWMCIKEAQLKKRAAHSEFFNLIFGGRYMILLMGIFSMYAGLMFNDCFSKAFTIFRSAWHTNYTVAQISSQEKFSMDPGNPLVEDKWPYAFGDDPVWDTAENKVIFVNSMKMKLSIIFGVAQMLFGISLSLFNHIYSKNWIDIFCEFIPQLLFISCLFLYMDTLIIFKWIYFSAKTASSAPSVLITMINMCLLKYSKDASDEYFVCHNLMYLQYALILTAVLTVPWMLIIKPLYLRARANRRGWYQKRRKCSASRAVSTAEDVETGQQNRPEPLSPNVDVEPSLGALMQQLATFNETAKGAEELEPPQNLGNESGDQEIRPSAAVFDLQAHGDEIKSREEGSEAFAPGSLEMQCRPSSQSDYSEVASVSRRPNNLKVTTEEQPVIVYSGMRLNKRTPTLASVATMRSRSVSVARSIGRPEREKFDFAEVFIHQAIHTIEYVLGLISHTASYLRLWALSLAHSELSTVLWTMVFRRGLYFASAGYAGSIAVFIIFLPWACLTLAILVAMEGMSAFLHALRLHWVEFQSKFYKGGGKLFQPFNFKSAYAIK